MSDKVLTVDLDDTLIPTQVDYDNSREKFAEWIVNNFDVEEDKEEVMDNQSNWSYDLLDEYGLSRKRFPQACVESYKDVVGDEENTEKAREIGEEAIGSVEFYEQKEFLGGVESFLEEVSEQDDLHTVLLTAGDEVLQNRKIEAKDLDEYFDECLVTSRDKKEEVEDMEFEELYHVGNSKSSDVEPLMDLDGVSVFYIPNKEWIANDLDVNDHDSVEVLNSISEVDLEDM